MEYGIPIYMTINASEVNEDIDNLVKKAINEANECGSVLYLTINSGKPTDPPPPPGGGMGG